MARKIGGVLDPRSEEPLYRQLFDQIVERIRSGTFPAGYRLPPSRSLAGEIRTHRNTVVRAYEDLEAAGFVHSTVGRGTFVAEAARPDPPERAEAPGARLPWATLLARAVESEPLARAERIAGAVRSASRAINLNRMQAPEDLLPHDLFKRCLDHVLRTVGPGTLGYAPRQGLPRLQALIAEDLQRQGVPAAAGEIVVTTGSQQALDLAVRMLVNPGDPFLVDETTYPGALSLIAAAGARLVGIPADDEGPDLAALDRHSRSGIKGLYLMPNCQNPTGARISAARREALVAWSRRAQVPLIEDDYAADLELEGDGPPPALRSLDGDVIYFGTFSKKLIPALRIGFLLCPPPLLARLTVLRHAMDLGASALLQYALAEFIDRGYLRAHLARIVPEYRRRRDVLADALRKHLPAGFDVLRPAAGLTLWLPLPPSIESEALFEEAQRQGVIVSPGSANGVDPRRRGGVRLTFCSEPPERLVEGARRLAKALAALTASKVNRAPRRSDAGRAIEGV